MKQKPAAIHVDLYMVPRLSEFMVGEHVSLEVKPSTLQFESVLVRRILHKSWPEMELGF